MRYYRHAATILSGLSLVAQSFGNLKHSPVALALVMAVIASLGPDHICMLMVLSMDIPSNVAAFKVGCLWGFGHSLGMVLVCVLVIPLGLLVNDAVVETYGSYCAGILMMLVGLFFLYSESRYVERGEDGNVIVHACTQCNHGGDADIQIHQRDTCSENTYGHSNSHAPALAAGTGGSKATPQADDSSWRRGFLGVVIGLLQGILCPSCLLGAGLASQFGAAYNSPPQAILFLTVLMVATSVLTGLLAMAFCQIASWSSSAFRVSHLIVYRATSCFLVFFGLTWLILTAFGVVDRLELHPAHSIANETSHSVVRHEDMMSKGMT